MDYKEQLSQNAEANFQSFQKKQLQKTPQEIFDNAFEISSYTELYNYLIGSNDLEEDICKILCEDGDAVIDILFSQYIKKEYASIASWDDISDFIRDDIEYSRKPEIEM